MKLTHNESSDANRGARRDWFPELMVGLVAVMYFPLVSTLMGGLTVASHSIRLGLAVVGTLAFAKAVFRVRGANAWDKSICGGLVAFGALVAVLDFVADANT